jgi:hypothetical protein
MSTSTGVPEYTAKYLTDVAPGLYAGEARIYEVNPPFRGAHYLVTSSVTARQMGNSLGADLGHSDFHSETAIFPATADGDPDIEVLLGPEEWDKFTLEGVHDHEGALRNAGIEVQS